MIGRVKQRFTVEDDGTAVVTDEGFVAEIEGWTPGTYDVVVEPMVEVYKHEPDDPGGHGTQRSDPRR